MLALPHHVDALVADESIGFLDILRYRGGLKGIRRAVLGSSWRLEEPLTKMDSRRRGPSRAKTCRRHKKTGEVRRHAAGRRDRQRCGLDAASTTGSATRTGTARRPPRLAGLALVAQEVGDDASFTSAIDQMRSILELWLEARNGDPFVYDATYGGLVTEKGVVRPRRGLREWLLQRPPLPLRLPAAHRGGGREERRGLRRET